jgi:hypothetical protein
VATLTSPAERAKVAVLVEDVPEDVLEEDAASAVELTL